ncbi:lytic transglycosylase domain-containing protein [Paraburkholderia humisilvae]|uniref:Membrane-bound lytic murein transglycosylase F n=1 Tax=Paraburkholderia humisilvae TaxID=627669 RepID=A0A6J5DMN0_9BURK|nr:lytic transglycosylase domain-containing protein [Paraburkholderia humisilvae]CAB3755183.1 Membrane-bound lytic murein transglycosylase F [Paraburkholderia humisilvae]
MTQQPCRAWQAPVHARMLIAAAAALCIAAPHPAAAQAASVNPPRVMMIIGGFAEDRAGDAVARNHKERLSLVLQLDTPPLAASVKARVVTLFPLIEEAARTVDIDSALLMAVIDVESGGDPQAISKQGAAGLMQLMPATGRLYGAIDPFDPRQNVVAGARLLRRLLTRFGSLELALAAYNAGEDAVRRSGGAIPRYRETQRYVPQVVERYEHYLQAVQSMREQPYPAR